MWIELKSIGLTKAGIAPPNELANISGGIAERRLQNKIALILNIIHQVYTPKI